MLSNLLNIITGQSNGPAELENEVAEFRALKVEISKARCMVELDGDGNITLVNENTKNALGFSEKELLQQDHRSLVGKKYAAKPEYKEFWHNLTEGKVKRVHLV